MVVEVAGPPVADLPRRRRYVDLFLISFVLLFFELACIRWFGSMVVFLTFFTNLVLMACFLGMSVGCLAASRRANLLAAVIPLTLLAVFLAAATTWVYYKTNRVAFDVGAQAAPQQIYFGTEYLEGDVSRFHVPIEVVAGVFFVLIALVFTGLGQAMGRAFDAIPDRVAAYSTNVLGSLAGIAAFGAASWLWTTPMIWFALSLIVVLHLVGRRTGLQVYGSIALLMIVAMTSYYGGRWARVVWSPYYKITYTPVDGAIHVNNIQHQGIYPVEQRGPAYLLPHLLNRDAGRPPFEDVLIIGAGGGNDVQAALLSGARSVDAVEIDPVINQIGRDHHPNRPYQDPRVTVHLDDGRSFVRAPGRAYDLVAYALVDSLVLHSGYSSLRLESFLFTEQAFRDVKARLKPGGVFVMYNYYRQWWVVGRLARMAERVFGTKPLVISLPYQETIGPGTPSQYTLLLVGDADSEAVEAIRGKFERSPFWLNRVPDRNIPINGYDPAPPQPDDGDVDGHQWQKIGPAAVETAGIGRIPTDDWPFLYLREATIPGLNIRGMLIVAGLALAVLAAFAPVRTIRPNGRMFFLGAGFMLLETKGVVHMALLFGSTWLVNSIVFFAILVMILLSNLYVLAARPRRAWPFYALLTAALLVNVFVPMETFLSLPGAARVVASCAVVFLPVFFAGVIFAMAFRDSPRPDVDLGSNIGGVILGGLCENFSLLLGFNGLLVVAIGFYLLSAVLRPRHRGMVGG